MADSQITSPINIEQLSDDEKFQYIEQISQQALKKLTDNLKDFVKNFGEGIENNSNLINTEQVEKINEIFQKNIIQEVFKIIDPNNKDLTQSNVENESTIIPSYSLTILNQTSSLVESILGFKNNIDEDLPDLIDEIIEITTPILVCLIAAYSPALATIVAFAPIALSITKIIYKNVEFKALFDKLLNTVDKIFGEPQLNKVAQIGDNIGQIAEFIDTTASPINKFNFSLEGVKETLKEIKGSSIFKKNITTIADFADKFITSTKSQFVVKIDKISDNIIIILKDNVLKKEILKTMEGIINSEFNVVKSYIQVHNSNDKLGYIKII